MWHAGRRGIGYEGRLDGGFEAFPVGRQAGAADVHFAAVVDVVLNDFPGERQVAYGEDFVITVLAIVDEKGGFHIVETNGFAGKKLVQDPNLKAGASDSLGAHMRRVEALPILFELGVELDDERVVLLNGKDALDLENLVLVSESNWLVHERLSRGTPGGMEFSAYVNVKSALADSR